MKIIRLNENDVEKLVNKIINESHIFGKPTPDQRIADYILKKLKKERPEIQHQFISHSMGVDNFYGIRTNIGGLEADLFRVNFTNKSAGISRNQQGILTGGDFGIIKVYNVRYQSDLGKRKNVIGYAIKMTGDLEPLKIPENLARMIYKTVEEQYGDIRVFKAQRLIDKGDNDETDLFEPLGG